MSRPFGDFSWGDSMNSFLKRLESLQGATPTAAFARQLGVNQKTLDHLVKGERKPSVEIVVAICSKLNVSADWLLGLSDEKSRSGGEGDIWRKTAMASQRKLDKVNEALGKIIEGTKALQEAVK